MRPGSTILIAGSRQGIGRALSEHYANAGHTVFGMSRGESRFVHDHYQHLCADVTKEETLKPAFARIGASGSLEVLIYSAAVHRPGHSLMLPTSLAEEMLRTNLLGAFLVSRHALRLMKRTGYGRLIYLSSIAVPLSSPGTVMYGASKAGLEQLTHSFSREFADDDITFNTIGISIYPSTMLDALSDKALAETRSLLIKPNDLQLDELVAAIDFFASDAARQITGQCIYFGGVH